MSPPYTYGGTLRYHRHATHIVSLRTPASRHSSTSAPGHVFLRVFVDALPTPPAVAADRGRTPPAGAGRRPSRLHHRHHHRHCLRPRQPTALRRHRPGDLPRNPGVAPAQHGRPRTVHHRLPRRRRPIPAHRPLRRHGPGPPHHRPPGRRRPALHRDPYGARRRPPGTGHGHGSPHPPRRGTTLPRLHRARPLPAAARAAADRRLGPERGRYPRTRRRRHRRHRLDRRRVLGRGPTHHRQQHHPRRHVVRLRQRSTGRRALDPRGHEHLRRRARAVLGRARRLHHPRRHQRAPGLVHLQPARPGPRLGRTHLVALRTGLHPEPARRRHGRTHHPEQALRVRLAARTLARPGAHLPHHRRPGRPRPARRQPRLGRPLHRPRPTDRHAHHRARPARQPRHRQRRRTRALRLERLRRPNPHAAPRRPLDVAATHPPRRTR